MNEERLGEWDDTAWMKGRQRDNCLIEKVDDQAVLRIVPRQWGQEKFPVDTRKKVFPNPGAGPRMGRNLQTWGLLVLEKGGC